MDDVERVRAVGVRGVKPVDRQRLVLAVCVLGLEPGVAFVGIDEVEILRLVLDGIRIDSVAERLNRSLAELLGIVSIALSEDLASVLMGDDVVKERGRVRLLVRIEVDAAFVNHVGCVTRSDNVDLFHPPHKWVGRTASA